MRFLWVAIVVVVSSVADAKPVDPPRELIASIAVGPESTLDNIRAFANAIKPGAGAKLTSALVQQGIANVVAVGSLGGLDATGWMHVLVFDDGQAKHFALAARATDAKQVPTAAAPAFAIVKNGWALLGEKPIVEKLAPYVFGTLAVQPPPQLPGATVFVPALLARYQTQIAAARQQMLATSAAQGAAMSQMMESYFDAIMAMLADSDRMAITLDASKDAGAIDLALVPKPNSRLAKFVAVQKPTDYALFDKLPATTAPMLLGGHLEMGPYRDGMIALFSQMYGGSGDPVAMKDVVDAMVALLKTTTGDFAVTVSLAPGKGMGISQLFALEDPAGADKAITRLLSLLEAGRTFELGKVKTTLKTDPVSPTHDGITLRGYDVMHDISKMTAAEKATFEKMVPSGVMAVRIATFDKLGMIASAPSSITEAKRTIDAVRGKGPRYAPPAVIGQLLAASKQRKESAAFVIDLGSLIATFAPGKAPLGIQPILIAFGFADKTAHIRVGVPTSTVTALAKLQP